MKGKKGNKQLYWDMEYEYDKSKFQVLNEERIGGGSWEIFYLSKELKKGKYTWALRVDHWPGDYTNIITGVMTKA